MASMRNDVIGGFNSLLADQEALGGDARFTLVQFDSADPAEVLVDARSVARVRPLSAHTFVPRWHAAARRHRSDHQKQATGWTFAFLGAGLDAYGEAAGIGYDPRPV